MEKQPLATLEEFNVASTKADEEVVIVHDMDDYATNTWKTLPPVGLVFPARDLAGSNCGGVAVVGGPNGDRVAINPDYSRNRWRRIADAPFKVDGLTGHNLSGLIAFGGKKVAYIANYAVGVWAPLPDCPVDIEDISGFNDAGGPVICGGADNREVYYLSNYSAPQWQRTRDAAPFALKGIAGFNHDGVTAFGGENNRQVAVLDDYRGRWFEVRSCPVEIHDIAGSNIGGVAIIGGDSGHEVWLMTNYTSQIWEKKADVPRMKKIVGITGNNQYGVIVAGHPA